MALAAFVQLSSAMNSVFQGSSVSVREGQTCVEKLAQMFPQGSPVRIAVCVSMTDAGSADGKGRQPVQKQTMIEFGARAGSSFRLDPALGI